MDNTRGKFIVFEGIDGSGKTTQVHKLNTRMDFFEKYCTFTREASDGPIGKMLRDVYLSGKRKADPRIINYIYAADRLDHLTNEEDGIVKTLNEGLHVISDRYYMSSLAYYAMEFYGLETYDAEMKFILDFNQVNRDILEPDITFFIRLDPEVAMRRLTQHRDDLSVYETGEKLKRIAAAYEDAIRLLRAEGQNIFCIDGNLDENEILGIVCQKLDESGIIPGISFASKMPEEWMRGS